VTRIIFRGDNGHGRTCRIAGYLSYQKIFIMTTITANNQWAAGTATLPQQKSLLAKWNSLMESQADRKTLWFLVSLVFQGVFLLPVPAALIFYCGAPVLILAITLGLFFANIIAGMGGAGIKTLLWLFASSVAVHLLMILLFIL